MHLIFFLNIYKFLRYFTFSCHLFVLWKGCTWYRFFVSLVDKVKISLSHSFYLYKQTPLYSFSFLASFLPFLSYLILCSSFLVLGLPPHSGHSLLPYHFFKKKDLCIYLFLAVSGLPCCTGFSLVMKSRATLPRSARAPYFSGFSCYGAQTVAWSGSRRDGLWAQ